MFLTGARATGLQVEGNRRPRPPVHTVKAEQQTLAGTATVADELRRIVGEPQGEMFGNWYWRRCPLPIHRGAMPIHVPTGNPDHWFCGSCGSGNSEEFAELMRWWDQ